MTPRLDNNEFKTYKFRVETLTEQADEAYDPNHDKRYCVGGFPWV
jgi:hypothetical protein